MKRTSKLEKAEGPPHGDREAQLEEIEEMPDEKVAELYASAFVDVRVCEECGEKTWLIGASGHNSASECHNCGTAYKVIG